VAEATRRVSMADNVILSAGLARGELGEMTGIPAIDAMARKLTGTPMHKALDASDIVDVMLAAQHVREEAGTCFFMRLCVCCCVLCMCACL
jgi:hypothetical protein